jgi:hypothetical protein
MINKDNFKLYVKGAHKSCENCADMWSKKGSHANKYDVINNFERRTRDTLDRLKDIFAEGIYHSNIDDDKGENLLHKAIAKCILCYNSNGFQGNDRQSFKAKDILEPLIATHVNSKNR